MLAWTIRLTPACAAAPIRTSVLLTARSKVTSGGGSAPRAWSPASSSDTHATTGRTLSAGSAFDLVGKRIEVGARDDSDRSIAS